MARRAEQTETEKTPTQEAHLIGQADWDKLMRKIKAADSKLSEAKGDIGSAVDRAIADHNVHKDALRLIRKYGKKAPTAWSEFVLHLLHYAELGRLGETEDLVETPAERKARMKKPDAEAFANEEQANGPIPGNHRVRGGKVVDIREEAG